MRLGTCGGVGLPAGTVVVGTESLTSEVKSGDDKPRILLGYSHLKELLLLIAS